MYIFYGVAVLRCDILYDFIFGDKVYRGTIFFEHAHEVVNINYAVIVRPVISIVTPIVFGISVTMRRIATTCLDA